MKSLLSNSDMVEVILGKCSTASQVNIIFSFLSDNIKNDMLPALSVILYRQNGTIIADSDAIVTAFYDAGMDFGQDTAALPAVLAATHAGDTKVVKKLIEYGANINVCSKNDGRTPLMIAAIGDYELLQFFIDNGAEIDTTDCLGNTALRYAIGWSSYECAKILLDNGADRDKKMADGRTLYELAVEKGDEKIIELMKK